MIKRLSFVTLAVGGGPVDRGAWVSGATCVTSAPEPARPLRAVVCTSLVSLRDPHPRHDGVVILWFGGPEHLGRFEEWTGGVGRDVVAPLQDWLDPDRSPVVVAEERAVRGEGWLQRRWERGGPAYKHMALARRGAGLTPEEMSLRWSGHAGSVGSGSAAAAIPDDVRGLAYVQDHPLPRVEGEWAYDAVNEVWFDDLAGLQRRVDWFDSRRDAVRSDDLFSATWALAVREDIVPMGPAAG